MPKIFVSYKYADDQVYQGIDYRYWAEEKNEITGELTKAKKATVRAYVNYLEEIIGKDNIYKGERDGESLNGISEPQIWEQLKPKLYDSTVTLVVVSRGMRNPHEPEGAQWIPNEIRYSLREQTRDGRASAVNALLGVILPDVDGGYGYIYSKSDCPHCSHVRMLNKQDNPFLFTILKGNIFNRKSGYSGTCSGSFCNSVIYSGDHSYLHLATLEEFLQAPQAHIDRAVEIKDQGDQYYEIMKVI